MAYELLSMTQDTEFGVIKKPDPKVRMLGAVNREAVSCYLDATLFAMFARLDSFEPMLCRAFPDRPRKRLAALLRLWVNAMRTGKLVTTDITKQIQETLAACGWPEAATNKQQDASEAFTFITEKLELPMLSLKMDIFHYGKDDTDDHKIVQERLLEVAIPEEPAEGEPAITLESCLAEYFNGRIEVKRGIERRPTLGSTRSCRFSHESLKKQGLHVETTEATDSLPATPLTSPANNSLPPYSHTRSSSYQHHPPSIIHEATALEKEKALEAGFSIEYPPSAPGEWPRAMALRREIQMPAWQFFSLIPWYADASPGNDEHVAAQFRSKRPTLGICLKRYLVQNDGTAVRRSTFIDIPTEIGLPEFIRDDGAEDGGIGLGHHKLSLQSIVCHRGKTADSGHYVSIVRGSQKPSGEAEWLFFDDLALQRVRPVDVQEALRQECPYMLFYQVQPIEDDPDSILSSLDRRLPAYSSEYESPYTSNSSPYAITNDDTSGKDAKVDDPSQGSRQGRRSSQFADLDAPAGRPSYESVSGNEQHTQPPRGRSIGWNRDVRKNDEHTRVNGTAPSPARTNHYTNGTSKAHEPGPFSIGRKGSKQGRGSKRQSSSQGAEGRLSNSLFRLTGMIPGVNRSENANGSNGASNEGGNSDQPTENSVQQTEPIIRNGVDGAGETATPEEMKDKKEQKPKREKSQDKRHDLKQQPRSNSSDRDCIIM